MTPVRLWRLLSGLSWGYLVRDSYACRDSQVSQHTLAGQTAAVPAGEVLDCVVSVNKRGALVGFARHCGVLLACHLNSLGPGDI